VKEETDPEMKDRINSESTELNDVSGKERERFLDKMVPISHIGIWVFMVTIYLSFKTGMGGWPSGVQQIMQGLTGIIDAILVLGVFFYLFTSFYIGHKLGELRRPKLEFGLPYFTYKYTRPGIYVLLMVVLLELILYFIK